MSVLWTAGVHGRWMKLLHRMRLAGYFVLVLAAGTLDRIYPGKDVSDPEMKFRIYREMLPLDSPSGCGCERADARKRPLFHATGSVTPGGEAGVGHAPRRHDPLAVRMVRGAGHRACAPLAGEQPTKRATGGVGPVFQPIDGALRRATHITDDVRRMKLPCRRAKVGCRYVAGAGDVGR